MKYEYELLKVNDADAIIIRHFIKEEQYLILIDAGNLGDGVKIKNHLKKYYDTTYIDLAISTHPDKDHKDGFFELLEDKDVTIQTLWLTDPAQFITVNDIQKYRNKDNAIKAIRKVWCQSDDEKKNLIDIALDNNVDVRHVLDGVMHSHLPIKVVGPTEIYYKQNVRLMVEDYGVKTYAESEKGVYDDKYEIDDEECKSVMDKEEDPSPYNASSLIILYEPGDGKRLLFAGDANTTSLQMMIDKYKWMRKVDLLKVPHHGSKNNLNTKIIDALAPKKSYISAIGNLKHPNTSVVYWLSKYGDVYSTHKVHNYLHWATFEIEDRKGSVTIYPLKKKKVK